MNAPLGESVVAIRRRHASILLQVGANFFDVAQAYGVQPRVLLAWQQFENAKWDNDPYAGIGPGPDESYCGKWPSLEEELSCYMTMGLTSKHFSDEELRRRYLKYRAAVRKSKKDKERA